MGTLWQRGGINTIILLFFYRLADVQSSLPVDLAPEDKGER